MSTPEKRTICKESVKFILTNRSRNVIRFGRNVKCAQTPRKLNAEAAQSRRERGSASAAAAAAAAMQGRTQSRMLFFFHRLVKFMRKVQLLCVFSISSNGEIWYNRSKERARKAARTCNNCGKFTQDHAPQDMARKDNIMYYITINKLIEIRKPTRRIIMNDCAQYVAYICKDGETETRRIATITKINTHKWELKVTGHDTRNAESLNDAIEILNEMFMYEYEMENAYNGRIKTDAWKW